MQIVKNIQKCRLSSLPYLYVVRFGYSELKNTWKTPTQKNYPSFSQASHLKVQMFDCVVFFHHFCHLEYFLASATELHNYRLCSTVSKASRVSIIQLHFGRCNLNSVCSVRTPTVSINCFRSRMAKLKLF